MPSSNQTGGSIPNRRSHLTTEVGQFQIGDRGSDLREVRPPIEAAPGRVARYDTEYQRNGTRNLFMICEPKGGWRHVEVTERRTAVDFAHQMRWLVDEAYPDAEVVRLVLDNLNTHQLGSLYEAFEPCEARRIAQRLEFHYTPTHGSWLNPVLSLPKGWLRSS